MDEKFLERFWSKVDKRGPDECWLWLAGTFRGGYGSFSVNGINHYAHRVSYMIRSGPIAEGLVVMHACDTPSCVNPDHLSMGTQAENRADCKNKGRQARGEKNGLSKLTTSDVVAIRSSNGTLIEIANKYGVSNVTIGYIKRRIIWRHVE